MSNSFRPLPHAFYEPSARVVARRLLGHFLLRRTPEGIIGGPIVETEAYVQNDPACHAFVGLTNRTRVMFGPPGRAYVYLIYGFYYCFNTVCCAEGIAEAVLVRAIEPQLNIETMQENRGRHEHMHLASGPGKLCLALNIRKHHDGADLANADSEVFVAENPAVAKYRRKNGGIYTTTRVGINKAADWPLRFYLKESPFVSKRDRKLPAKLT